jgi:hypothetical protein
MRLLLVIALFALTGCPTVPDTQGTGTPTADPASMVKLGDQIDKADQRVAAGIAVASENADKPAVVKAELGVAASYLPKPDQIHIDYVRNRVARANPEEYKRAEDAGRKMLASIDARWANTEKEAAENKKAIEAANKKICDLEAKNAKLEGDLVQAKKDIVTYACAAIGGLLAIAAVALFWFKQVLGAISSAVGSACLLAFPALVETKWFLPSLAVLGGLLIVWAGAYLLLAKKTSPEPKEPQSPTTDEPNA